MKRLVLAATVATALAAAGAAANAANAPTTGTNTTSSAADAGSAKVSGDMNLRQHLQDELSKAGYSAVKITPTAFFIQAKDKKGDPVAMIIGPDSFTEVTDVLQKPSDTKAEQTANKTTPMTTQK